MDGASIVTTIVTVLSSATGALIVKSVIDGIRLAKNGVSGREDKRNASLIEQRDHALKLANEAEQGEQAERRRREEAEARVDVERENRRRAQDAYWRMRLEVIALGGNPGARVDFDDTEPGR